MERLLQPDEQIWADVGSIIGSTDGFWKYEITKSGYTNIVKLPNQ